MIQSGVYVRCGIDNEIFHRDFIIGKVKKIDEFSEQAVVEFFDVNGIGKYYSKPEDRTYSLNELNHCIIRNDSRVLYKNKKYIIKSNKYDKKTHLYSYYIESMNNEIEIVSETELICSYNDGYISPHEQLRNYEFQNPTWFFGRNSVSRTHNIINNSLYGFSEVAGCKIYLKSHQLRTIVRCLQDSACRYMIADEVGMGKTIEAASILKVYLKDHHNCKILVIAPDSLVEQWKTELAYKFKILEGIDDHENYISIIGISSIELYNGKSELDFIIVDEVHKYIRNEKLYKILLHMSQRTENILMLSATPVQNRRDEYKKLLTLIQPDKYLAMSDDKFNKLMDLQADIVRKTHTALENLDSYNEEIEDCNNKHTQDTKDAFEDVYDALEKINNVINDEIYKKIYKKIDYEAEDFGISWIEKSISYVCENYQLEKSIIRNRRCEQDEDIYNTRSLIDISYDMQTNFNNTEYKVYNAVSNWIENENLDQKNFEKNYKDFVSAMFSSASAFYSKLQNAENVNVDAELLHLARKWKDEEVSNASKLQEILGDPTEYASRLNNIVDFIDQEAYGQKVLVFTNYIETFSLYKNAFLDFFGEEHCAFFSKDMSNEERELNAYRFETAENYEILLSDESGGEGRNFQNADILIHIDIPWSANVLEQRIGRLDRIGRKENKPVISVVSYAKSTMEEGLFNFWNDGIDIFKSSQSGLEIIMNDMDTKIITAICNDFKYGLLDVIDDVKKEIKNLKEIITRERYFDIAEYKYQTINKIMDNTREIYMSNERELFSDSMMRWASLSGFVAKKQDESVVRFDASSFSLRSAKNTLFVPPDINLIINDQINQMQNKIRAMNNERTISNDINYIQGTFDRQIGINNDYIHFFAPGDPIYDSIVNNALASYKGTCTAFEMYSKINWHGFVFTWRLEPNKNILLDNNIPLHAIDKYLGFLPIEQIQSAISLSEGQDYAEEEVLKYFNLFVMSSKRKTRDYIHLGERKNYKIDKFIEQNPKDKWDMIVEDARKKSLNMIVEKIDKRFKKQLKLLKFELNKNTFAEKATMEFYNNENENENNKTDINKIIYQSFLKSKVILDSVCYVRMNNEI